MKYHVALSYFPKFGPIKIKKLKKYFPCMESAFQGSLGEFNKAGIETAIAEEFIDFRKKININKILDNLEKEKIKIILLEDKDYPKLLKEIYNPPPLLYYKGTLIKKDEFPLAVVGSRKNTSYGQQTTEKIVKDLITNNITIVSGLALGIDTAAHLACLENYGRTVAVLGSGLDKLNLYPRSNSYLIDKIILNNGAVISEFPPGTPPLKHHFPQRNRIISGLSLGTLVIEAAKRSGALITAYLALEQNREVFAVPGNIFSSASEGPNKLIKKGAQLVESAEDIIKTLNLSQIITHINNKEIIGETAEEKILIPLLSHEPEHIDNLVRKSNLSASEASSCLTIMEMKGIVQNLGGMRYVLANSALCQTV